MDITGYIYTLFRYYIENNVEEIKSTDLYFDQFTTENTGETDATSNPKVLIEIEPIEFVKMFGGVQNAVATVRLHIGIDIFNTFKTSELLDTNLAYISLLGKIYEQLSGICAYELPEELQTNKYILNNVERSGYEFSTNTGSVKVSTITFDINLEDNSLLPGNYVETVDDINVNVLFN